MAKTQTAGEGEGVYSRDTGRGNSRKGGGRKKTHDPDRGKTRPGASRLVWFSGRMIPGLYEVIQYTLSGPGT